MRAEQQQAVGSDSDNGSSAVTATAATTTTGEKSSPRLFIAVAISNTASKCTLHKRGSYRAAK